MRKGEVLVVNKPQGMTPLQLVEEFKKTHTKYTGETISYAGRLDPMAEGAMILLIGETNKDRRRYERMPKKYEFDVLFGVATDTYDDLGMIVKFESHSTKATRGKEIIKYLDKLKGKHMQKYPPYSSARVRGKPLFWWARQGRLSEIEIPAKSVVITSIKLKGLKTISSNNLKNLIVKRIKRVHGDFRQKEILETWDRFFRKTSKNEFQIASVKISCSSGAYVRSIANDLGEALGVGAIAIRIRRIKIG